MASRTSAGNLGGGARESGNGKENGGPRDSVFDLDSEAFASDQFRMHEFKVKRCPRARPHDWTQCPFAHPGEKARRRDPRRYKYSGTACPEFRKSGCCRRGDACPFAHGVFECWLHPSRYRTQLCTDGTNCKRRVCFFAHVESELRHPEDDPGVAQKQVQAELAAEVQNLQQQHLTQALQTLLLQTANPVVPTSAPERPAPQLPALTLEMLKQNSEMPSNEMLPDHSVDTGNSTAALQVLLLQQLAAKEQQLQQNMGNKTSEVPVSNHSDNGFNGSAVSSVQHQPDVYDTLSQLKQLSLSAAAPIVSNSPAVGLSFDPSSLISHLMPNGATVNGGTVNGTDMQSQPSLIDNLLTQNGVKVGAQVAGQNRRSIDNSYLPSLMPDATAQTLSSLGVPTPPYQNGFLAGGTNGVAQDTSTNPGQIPATSNGVYPAVSDDVPAYSVEGIQRLLQNPAFSSNLSQLFQMNPALLQQLTSSPMEAGNPGRHSIDNAYLQRLNNTDMSRFVTGGMPGMANGDQTTMQHDTLMMNGFSNPPQPEDKGVLSSAIAPDALLQELNALQRQLGNNQTTALSNGMQGSEGHMSLPNQASPDSDFSNASAPLSMSQNPSEGLN